MFCCAVCTHLVRRIIPSYHVDNRQPHRLNRLSFSPWNIGKQVRRMQGQQLTPRTTNATPPESRLIILFYTAGQWHGAAAVVFTYRTCCFQAVCASPPALTNTAGVVLCCSSERSHPAQEALPNMNTAKTRFSGDLKGIIEVAIDRCSIIKLLKQRASQLPLVRLHKRN